MTRCILLAVVVGMLMSVGPAAAGEPVGRYEIFEASFESASQPVNPYLQIGAEAVIERPDGGVWRIPLFWAGGKTWKIRISPDVLGPWAFTVYSGDSGLRGAKVRFTCVESDSPGGIQVDKLHPQHFQRQNGEPFWFMGDTAWGYFTDSPEDNHHRQQALHYAKTRASQGFNVIHSMMLSEQGVGNQNGLPFDDLAAEKLNPKYWDEMDSRLAYANEQGLTVGMAIAWADKSNGEPFSWNAFPSIEARRRYARYAAARYSAYDVFFLISGEWEFEYRARKSATPNQVFEEFMELGNVFDAAEPHGRMIGVHANSSNHGSARDFASAPWCSFADYQQNYTKLHERILLSRELGGPVVNSEYAYYLRDADGNGFTDKRNSYSADDIRHASWDIATAGGYLVTGFGSTYFAGYRDPGLFDVDAAKNDVWEEQIGYIERFFTELEWWNLVPADQALTSKAQRTGDRDEPAIPGKQDRKQRAPATTYWAMQNPGKTYVLYVRGTTEPVTLETGARKLVYSVRQYNPGAGTYTDLRQTKAIDEYVYTPPSNGDWVVLLEHPGN